MIASFAPIAVTVEFVFSDGDNVARAEFECPAGELPTEDDIATAAANVTKQVQAQLGEAFTLQARENFVQDLFEAKTGQRGFAVPGKDEWEADWAKQS